MTATLLDARILAIKQLNEMQLQTMHEREEARYAEKGPYLPYEIVRLARLGSISDAYGVTNATREEWAEHVHAEIWRELAKAKIPAGDEPGRTHAIDWTLWHAKMDLTAGAATRKGRPAVAADY